MSRPLADLPGMAADLSMSIAAGKRTSVMDAALVAKDEFLAGPPRVGVSRDAKFIPTAAKPDGSTGWNARFDIKGFSDPTALIRYTGPLHWIERGTSPHMIAPRLRGRRRRGARAMVFPDGGVRTAPVRHPGTRARPFFDDVKARSAEAATKTVRSGLRRNIAKAGFSSARQLL